MSLFNNCGGFGGCGSNRFGGGFGGGFNSGGFNRFGGGRFNRLSNRIGRDIDFDLDLDFDSGSGFRGFNDFGFDGGFSGFSGFDGFDGGFSGFDGFDGGFGQRFNGGFSYGNGETQTVREVTRGPYGDTVSIRSNRQSRY